MISVARGALVPATTIHAVVLATAERYPDRIAVRCGPQEVRYDRLAADAGRIATVFRELGVRPGDIVPVAARRGAQLPALLLGVLMAGGAYALLDPRWPQARIEDLIAAMHPAVIVADPAGAKLLAGAGIEHLTLADLLLCEPAGTADGAAAQPLPEVAPTAIACLFWTSGSTGRAKGVLSPHQATTRLFGDHPCVPFGEAPVMANAAAVPWDAFSLELWGMLLRGGTVLAHEDDLLLPSSIRSYIHDYGMTHLFLTPSLFEVLVQADLDCLAGLRVLILGGDKPSPQSCARFLAAFPETELYNGYGPVESCVFASSWRITPADLEEDQGAATGMPAGMVAGIPIGRPIADTGLCVVRDGVPVPRGEPGEIAIFGSGLARGYLDDPRRTAEVFRRLVVDGREWRAYLTGDQGWMDDRGVLHFAGRTDTQFKIAGHRIEAGEVESAARSAGCAQALALPLSEGAGAGEAERLVLFAVPAETGLTEAELRSRMAGRLPAYMVPARVHFAEAFPLLENTKIDKRRLAESAGYRNPGTPNPTLATQAGGKR